MCSCWGWSRCNLLRGEYWKRTFVFQGLLNAVTFPSMNPMTTRWLSLAILTLLKLGRAKNWTTLLYQVGPRKGKKQARFLWWCRWNEFVLLEHCIGDIVVVLNCSRGSMGTYSRQFFLGLCPTLTWEVLLEPSSLIPSVAGYYPGRNGRCEFVWWIIFSFHFTHFVIALIFFNFHTLGTTSSGCFTRQEGSPCFGQFFGFPLYTICQRTIQGFQSLFRWN